MRIGVNVPNELLERVKEIEPRVNISSICRKAIERRVDTAERAKAQANADGVDEHVARLVKSGSAPKIEPDWEAYALEDAAYWVSNVSSDYWEEFTFQSDEIQRQGRDQADMVAHWSHRGETCGLTYRLYRQNNEWFTFNFKLQYVTGGGPDLHKKATEEYSRAWLGYVTEIRRKIDQHYKDEYKRVMAEQAAYRLTLPKPEVPSQLI